MTSTDAPAFDEEDRRALIKLMLDLQTKHGFPFDDVRGVVHSAAFIAHGLAASITLPLGGHTSHTLTADWFTPENAEHVNQAIELLTRASSHLKAAVAGGSTI